jgi:glycosyltransferase involved in cell wall biosynthesis
MASALPVVATRVGGNADLVFESVTGLLVPPATPSALAAAICGLADDPQRAARMGRAGRISVEQRFSLSAMVSAYQGLYEAQLEHARLAH